MKKLILIPIFLSFQLPAIECLQDSTASILTSQSMQPLQQITYRNLCEAGEIKDQDELDTFIRLHFNMQYNELKDKNYNRHEVAKHYNQCEPNKESKVLVINFQGTGAFNPHSFHIMTAMMKCLDKKTLADGLENNIYASIHKKHKSMNPNAKWSALDIGPINQFFKDPILAKNRKHFDFATFASEESEGIANPNSLSKRDISTVVTGKGFPIGAISAAQCTLSYLIKAKKLGIKPKITVLSHSSGGTAAVKYMEMLKTLPNPLTGKNDIQVSNVFSIDPVKEAQLAFSEVLDQYGGKLIGKSENKGKLPKVHSRKQPEKLYKPDNVEKWTNVYQNVDTDGMKMSAMPFGICGSPVHNADVNKYIKTGLGSSAHGEIGYHEETIKLFLTEFHSLL